MQKIRLSEIAKETGLKSKEVFEKAIEIQIEVKSFRCSVTEADATKITDYILSGNKPSAQKKEEVITQNVPKIKKIEKIEKEVSIKPIDKPIENKSSEKEVIKSNSNKSQDKSQDKKSTNSEDIKKDVENKSEEKVVKITPKVQEEDKSSNIDKQQSNENLEKTVIKTKTIIRRVGVTKGITRSGLKIVKKKKQPEPEIVKPVEVKKDRKAFKKSLTPNLKDLFNKNDDNSNKKIKVKTKIKATKREGAQKLDFDMGFKANNNNSSFNHSNNNNTGEREEVVLLSLNDMANEKKDVKLDESRLKVAKKASSSFNNNRPRTIRRSKRRKAPRRMEKVEDVKTIKIPEDIRVYEFAEKINKTTSEIMSTLFKLGTMVTKNDFLDKDMIEILAEEFEVEVVTIDPLEELDYVNVYDETENKNLTERAPIITIMGHVDHGKTSLLDKIRDAKVADKEAGGITQHIGAYTIEKDNKKITFIDTPGHEAFSAMRARGAMATDIVIIVVAADDGVKPQTIESIAHAKDANLPIIIAVNKIDKPDANADLAKTQMSEHGITPVDWGGNYDFINVSARTGEGIEDLLETILLEAESLELTADIERDAKAIVIESSIEKGMGAVATVIVKNGTLNVGDSVIADTTSGKVKAIINDNGKRIKEIKAGETGVVIGLGSVPAAGSIMVSVENDKIAKAYAEKRADYKRLKELSKSTKVSFDELSDLIAEGKLKTLPIILKTDVQGSLEAIKGSLEKLRNEEVKIDVIHSAVGGITESDLALANANDNIIILGFNVRPTGSVKQQAKCNGVEIKTYSIIYDLINDVKSLLGGMMSPVVSEEVTGQAEVRDTFTIAKIGTIAGCMVTDGLIKRNGSIRLIRDGVVVYTTKISSLKRFKDDAKEVSKGYDCGIMLEGYNDIKVGDFMETFIEVEAQAEMK